MKAKTNGAWLTVASAAVIAFVFVSCRPAAVEAAYPVEKAKVGFFRGLATRISGAFRGAKASVESARLKREVAALAGNFRGPVRQSGDGSCAVEQKIK